MMRAKGEYELKLASYPGHVGGEKRPGISTA